MIRKTAASAFLFASCLAAPAQAEDPAAEPSAWPRAVTVTARIDYGDLDLTTAAGAAEAQRRVARAVGEMCRPNAVPAGAGRGRIDGHCFREAMANARAQIERVIAAHSGSVRTAHNAVED